MNQEKRIPVNDEAESLNRLIDENTDLNTQMLVLAKRHASNLILIEHLETLAVFTTVEELAIQEAQRVLEEKTLASNQALAEAAAARASEGTI